MAESIIGLYKAELIGVRGPWRTVEDVELATLSWVHWWNHQRLLEPIGSIPPIEHENNWRQLIDPEGGAINQPSAPLPDQPVGQLTQ
ncbi:hypothetical protein BH18ACT6_BH18ACT6_26260 [soil metagenome]